MHCAAEITRHHQHARLFRHHGISAQVLAQAFRLLNGRLRPLRRPGLRALIARDRHPRRPARSTSTLRVSPLPWGRQCSGGLAKRASNAANANPKLYTLAHDCLGKNSPVHHSERVATGPWPCIRALSSACAPWISGDRLHLVVDFLWGRLCCARLFDATSLQEKCIKQL